MPFATRERPSSEHSLKQLSLDLSQPLSVYLIPMRKGSPGIKLATEGLYSVAGEGLRLSAEPEAIRRVGFPYKYTVHPAYTVSVAYSYRQVRIHQLLASVIDPSMIHRPFIPARRGARWEEGARSGDETGGVILASAYIYIYSYRRHRRNVCHCVIASLA